MNMQHEKIKKYLNTLGITFNYTFVPFSQSRNRNKKDLSLNWLVLMSKNGKAVFSTDYSMGVGHCQAYKQAKKGRYMSWEDKDNIKQECETGKYTIASALHNFYRPTKQTPLPDDVDVMYSLVMDAEAIDYPTYENWAGCFGYDEDSRSGEKIYKACLETGLRLRAALGDVGLSKLRELYQDY